mgnify:CR=1 FL=1
MVVETIDSPGGDESLLEILDSSNDLPNDSAADQQSNMSDLPPQLTCPSGGIGRHAILRG